MLELRRRAVFDVSQSGLNVEGKRERSLVLRKCKGTEDKMTEREVSCKDLTPLVSGLRGWFWPRECAYSMKQSNSSRKLCADRPSIA